MAPRLRTAEDSAEERHASWLELFFDLVFVIAIAELAHQLELDHSAAGLLRFAALFVPVYVAWQGFSIYADRFDTDDLLLRVALLAGMLAIAALAVQIEDVSHEKSAGFAVSYIALRSILLALYARAWRAVPAARPLISRYGLGYATAVAIWVISLALDAPARYVLWAVAVALDLSLPPLSTRLIRRVPTHGGHIVERWGLFTLIVLGESVVVVALGVAGLGLAGRFRGGRRRRNQLAWRNSKQWRPGGTCASADASRSSSRLKVGGSCQSTGPSLGERTSGSMRP
ncbi:MAG: low temperature requirement protein A [Actinobacteria bacterium]|nr:low temperature requirement protein A [Actinomycetota bacterium]